MLPGGSSRVGDNLFVRRENSITVFKGLADQHPVERWPIAFRVMSSAKERRRYRAADSFGLRQGGIRMFSIPGG